jgi:hypothetical protein
MTAKMISAGTSASNGATVCTHTFACDGVTSSLVASLMPSAMGWSSPNGPTRFGPRRTWMRPITRRSVYVR